MRHGVFHAALTVALVASGAAAAQIDGFKACASISDGAKRLSCYDSALAAADSEAAARLAEQRRVAEIAAAKAAEEAMARREQERLAAFGASSSPKIDGEEAVSEISASIAEIGQGMSGYVVTLDNGQVWRQTEARTLPPVRVGDTVTIRKGMMGGYRMTFERQKRTVPAKRVN